MEGHAKPIVQYLEGSEKRFLIPVYQRNYEWNEVQCRQLYNDLEDVVKYKRVNHFFGSIVSINYGGGYEFQIIDGQQRITTISLLILALHILLETNKKVSTDDSLKTRLLEEYLVDKYKKEDHKIKLKTTNNNQKYYLELFKDPDTIAYESNIVSNFKYFTKRILESKLTADEIFSSIKKLTIIDIIINEKDDPQKIFESINSTGLDLSEADKIRNYILMDLSPDKQEEYYDKYWNKIETNCLSGSNMVSMFFRDYLTIKTSNVAKIGGVYQEFKVYFETNQLEKGSLLEDIYKFSKLYNIILTAKTDNQLISYSLKRINQLEATVTYPFLLMILMLREDGELDNGTVLKIMESIETFLFRRTIVELPSNALSKIFSTIHKEILKQLVNNDYSLYFDIFAYELKNRRGNARFPKDDEFTNGLRVKEIYLMNQKSKHYMFEKFENEDSVEHMNVYDLLKNSTLTIEHVMPQELTPEWKDELGADWNTIHQEWLHRLGNLSLTGYNSKYSNSSFTRKKSIEKGFDESNLKLNKYIKSVSQWTKIEMQNREDILVKKALTIWKEINTNFVPKNKGAGVYSLLDEFDYTYFLVKSYSFQGHSYEVDSWREMFENIIKQIYNFNRSKFISILSNHETVGKYINHKTLESFELEADIMFVHHLNSNSKVNILRMIFDSLGYDQNDLTYNLVKSVTPVEPDSGSPIEQKSVETPELWSSLRKDFESKIKQKCGVDLKYSTYDGNLPFVSKTDMNKLRIKLSYSKNYDNLENPEFKAIGWNALSKNIVTKNITHFVFALHDGISEFTYFIFSKKQFINEFKDKLEDKEKNFNFYFGIDKEGHAFERRGDSKNVSIYCNNWDSLKD